MFKVREFATGQTAGIFATIAMATAMLLFPFYWQTVRGYSAESAGLLMFPLPVTLMFVAPTTGRSLTGSERAAWRQLGWEL